MEKTVARTDCYKEQTRTKKACILAILTAFCSFTGWIAETLLFYYWRGEYVDRGLLTLPFCPLYGLSMLAAYGIMRTPQSGFWAKWKESAKTKTGRITVAVCSVILYAVLAAALATIAEYITGAFYNKRFGIRLWSYRKSDNNISGYVCLSYSLLWGILAVSFMGLIWYPSMQLLSRVDVAVLAPVALTLVMLLAADFAYNMAYLHIKGVRYEPPNITKALPLLYSSR